MQKTEYRCVVDSHSFYKTFVLLESYEENGHTVKRPYSYTMLPGETLIEASPPSDMLRAKWSGTDWQETASKEEIEADVLRALKKQHCIHDIDPDEMTLEELCERIKIEKLEEMNARRFGCNRRWCRR